MNKEIENVIKKTGACEDYIVICDHASNNIPIEYENLGISKKDLESHRAFDLGASEVATELSNLLLFDSVTCCSKSTYIFKVLDPEDGFCHFKITGSLPKPLIP